MLISNLKNGVKYYIMRHRIDTTFFRVIGLFKNIRGWKLVKL